MSRYYYKSDLSSFVNDDVDRIFGIIARGDVGDSVSEQKYAWSEEIEIMQKVLQLWKDEEGEIVFEYSIPRLGKRIDVVLLLHGIIFVILGSCVLLIFYFFLNYIINIINILVAIESFICLQFAFDFLIEKKIKEKRPNLLKKKYIFNMKL